MAIEIDAELVTDLEDIDPKVLAYCIKEHQKTLERFNMLSDYYDGKHKIIERVMDNENSKNAKVMVNNAKVVTDMMVGFTGGNPVSYSPKKGNDIKPVLDVYEEVDIASHDLEMLKDLSVFGIAYELHYTRVRPGTEDLDINLKELEPRIKSVDPRGIFLVTDDTLEKNKLFGCHYYEKFGLDGASTGFQVDVYTKAYVTGYRTDDLTFNEGKYEKTEEPKETYYSSVPVIEIRNNEEKQGDFEQQISLIDAYNLLQSDRIADKEAFVDSLLVLFGFDLGQDENGEDKKLVKDGIISAPPKGADGGADIAWLTKAFVEKDVQVLATSIEDDIHKTTYVPNLNDEKFGGTISGEAMKYKLFGLLQLLATKTRYLSKGLKERLELTANLLNVQSTGEVDVTGTKINIKANLPINTSEVISMIQASLEFVPLMISLGWLPDIDDPEEILEMLYDQKERETEMNLKALGNQASNNQDGDFVEDEEDEEEVVTKKGGTKDAVQV